MNGDGFTNSAGGTCYNGYSILQRKRGCHGMCMLTVKNKSFPPKSSQDKIFIGKVNITIGFRCKNTTKDKKE